MGRSKIVPLPISSVGIGLRVPLLKELISTLPKLDFLEVIAENYFDQGSFAWRWLDELKEHYPIVVHSVGSNLLGSGKLNDDHLQKLKAVADRLNSPLVSDHLCWSSIDQFHSYDLLPVPHKEDLVSYAADRAKHIQDCLQRPFAIENLSSYLQFTESDLTEWEFYNAVVKESQCHYLLDINNIFVSSHNLDFDASRYLESIDYSRVVQIHLAGHEQLENNFIVDTHDSPIRKEVWDLFDWVCEQKGNFPTLIEWDDKIPNLSTVLCEMKKAGTRRAR